ncbi:MAG TPA: efflux RND transporter permease subunit, partial [Candidatus Methylomirabilis sp.]|nr:efflux RND transporter permease subunit [Candidatus Methylomirabilis sp.]
ISAFNALTLSPALAALLLRPRRPMRGPLGAFFGGFNRWFARATDGYVATSGLLIRKAVVTLLLLVVISSVAGLLGWRLPGGFVPEEDQGYMSINVQLPAAASLERTAAVCDQIDAVLKSTSGVQHYTVVIGAATTNTASYFLTLDPWEERDKKGRPADVIIAELNQRLAAIPAARAFAVPPPAIPGVGASGGITFMLEDRAGKNIKFLTEQTRIFLEAARKRPELASVNTTFTPAVPQIFADVNQDKVLKQNVSLTAVYQTLQVFLGGYFVNDFNLYGRVWQVYVQAEGEFRTRADYIDEFYVRNAEGKTVPLSAMVTMKPSFGPDLTIRFNEYRAAEINAALAHGYSTQQGMRALEEVFRATMPREMGFDYAGMSFQEQAAAQGVPPSLVFGLSLLVVFLILAAQYESWSLPLGVLLGTPIAVFGALVALWVRRFEMDVFSQIGLVMIIGLAAKNAILIVEFSKAEYERGASLYDAALAGARLRLRPILMTAFAFILGVMPLVVATGAGASSRRILGTTVLGGMLAATVIAVFVIPATFAISQRFARRDETPARLPGREPTGPAGPGAGPAAQGAPQ